MSQTHSPGEAKPTANVYDDAVAAIEAKREPLERLANSEYPLADHAGALLEIADNHN